MADKDDKDKAPDSPSATHTQQATAEGRSIEANPSDEGAMRDDGWVTDSTPTPEPQHVIERNARESAEALQATPGPHPYGAIERPMAPGALEASDAQRAERAEDQDKQQEQANRANAERPTSAHPTSAAHEGAKKSD